MNYVILCPHWNINNRENHAISRSLESHFDSKKLTSSPFQNKRICLKTQTLTFCRVFILLPLYCFVVLTQLSCENRTSFLIYYSQICNSKRVIKLSFKLIIERKDHKNKTLSKNIIKSS